MVATAAAALAIGAMAVRRGRIRRAIGIAAVTAAVALAVLLSLGEELPIERIASIFDPSTAGRHTRVTLWGRSLDAWADRPLWGYGAGSFEVAISPYLRRDEGVVYKRAENEYIDTLVEGGLLGAGLLLALIGSIGRRALRAWRTAPDEAEAALVLGGLFGLVALAVHSLGDFSPHVPGLGLTALVLAGHLCRLGAPGPRGVAAEAPAATAPEPRRRRSSGAAARRPTAAAPVALAIQSALIGLALLALLRGAVLARAEAALFGSEVPLEGPVTRPNAIGGEHPSTAGLDRTRRALEAALEHRPDWAEGYLLLGMTHLRLYETLAARWVADVAEDERTRRLAFRSPLDA